MPSAAILAQKQEQLQELVEKMRNASSGVLVNYTGITVDQDTAMRTALRKANVEYKVYKNTMISRACDELGYTDLKPHLNGMTAIATSTDPIAPAKILKEYAENIPTFEIKAGFIDGEIVDQAGVMELASIPSKEVLIGKIVGSLMGPLYGLAYALQAIADKGESAPAEETAAPAEEAAPAAEAPAAE